MEVILTNNYCNEKWFDNVREYATSNATILFSLHHSHLFDFTNVLRFLCNGGPIQSVVNECILSLKLSMGKGASRFRSHTAFVVRVALRVASAIDGVKLRENFINAIKFETEAVKKAMSELNNVLEGETNACLKMSEGYYGK